MKRIWDLVNNIFLINIFIGQFFDDLCNQNDNITKKRLMDILDEFGLEINYNQFFSPLAKKNDQIFFEDFCCLFKANEENQEIFRKTFGQDLFKPLDNDVRGDNEEKKVNPNYPFPIKIVKKH